MSIDDQRPNAFFTYPEGYLGDTKLTNLSESEMVKILQGQDNTTKIPLLKSLVYRISNGEHFPKILMSLMNCLGNDNKVVKKLALMCWESIDRYDSQGKLLSEAILICNALKTNLEHPNEYIRGAALRCAAKLLDIELLDPILPTIILNLDHNHVYVRRHTLMCIQHIASHSPELNQYISHLEDKIFQIASTEYNQTCRYHALLTLTAINVDRAIDFFDTISNSLHIQPGVFIEAVLALISKTYQTHRRAVPSYTHALTLLLHKIAPGIATVNNINDISLNTSLDYSTIYAITQALLMISSNESSIKLALKVLIVLLKTAQGDVVSSLIVGSLTMFTRGAEQQNYASILSPFILDILSVLPFCDGSIKDSILDLTLLLCSHTNVESIVSALRKEYLSLDTTTTAASTNPLSSASDHADITLRNQVAGSSEQQYRHNLFKTLHQIAIRHATVLPTIAPLLSLAIADPNPLAGLNALRLVREIILVHKPLRKNLLERLCDKFHQIRNPEILRGVVWIFGEFAGTDVITPSDINPNQPFVPTSGDRNDINNLYAIGTFLVHAIGLESFIPQQQLFEYNSKMELAKAAAQTAGKDFDEKDYHEQNNLIDSGSNSQPRTLIYNGDMHFAASFTTALTKIVSRIYNYHCVINKARTAALPQHNRAFQQLHSSIVLIITRILKYVPKIPAIEVPSSMPSQSPQSIHAAMIEKHDSKVTQFELINENEFTFFPESSYLGIGADCFERIAMNLKICLYPQDFAYVIPLAQNQNGLPESVFATSAQALQQSLRYEHQHEQEMKSLVSSNAKKAVNGITGESKPTENIMANPVNNTSVSLTNSAFGLSLLSNAAGTSTTTSNNLLDELSPPTTSTSSSTTTKGLKIGTIKPRTSNIHKPIPIRLMRKNLEGTTQRPNLNIITYQEDLNLAVTGSKTGNIYQPTTASASTAALTAASQSAMGSSRLSSNGSMTATQYMAAKSKSQGLAVGVNNHGITKNTAPTIHQLTGLSDLIYAEAKLIIQMYDIILDITLINQTTTTLQNVSIEIQTSTDLALSSPPATFSLAPKGTIITTKSSDGTGFITENPSHHTCSLRFNVNSTETGLIYGNIVCDTASSGNSKNIITIQPVVIDVSQYLTPAACLATDYRSMWSEFEWENKVLISTNITNPIEFIQFVTMLTNMYCLTPLDAFTQQIATNIDGQTQMPEFIAANLYAISSFGEQALLNISVECINGRLTGCMRVRAKTCGVARSLGDLIKNKQRL